MSANPQHGSRFKEQAAERRTQMESNGAQKSDGKTKGRPRVVVVGSGFAGFTCIREWEKRLAPEDAELVLVSPTDYMLYSPPLPEVAAGGMPPRHVVVPLHGALKRARVVLGYATGVDLGARTCTVSSPNAPDRVLGWDRLVLAPGGVTRSFPIPGLAERARGFKTLAEVLYLRDHVLQQLELADASDDPEERRARCTFVVVGAGYSGTECAAQLPEPGAQRPPLDASRRCAAGAARARRAPGRGLPRVAQAARGRDPARDQHRGSQRGKPQALRRRERAHPHARLVRRGRGEPARRHPGATTG